MEKLELPALVESAEQKDENQPYYYVNPDGSKSEMFAKAEPYSPYGYAIVMSYEYSDDHPYRDADGNLKWGNMCFLRNLEGKLTGPFYSIMDLGNGQYVARLNSDGTMKRHDEHKAILIEVDEDRNLVFSGEEMKNLEKISSKDL